MCRRHIGWSSWSNVWSGERSLAERYRIGLRTTSPHRTADLSPESFLFARRTCLRNLCRYRGVVEQHGLSIHLLLLSTAEYMPGQSGSVKLQRDHWQRKTFSWFSEEQDRNCPVGLPWTVGESAAFSCMFGRMRLRRQSTLDSSPALFVSEDTL